jgi:hypothetical protein
VAVVKDTHNRRNPNQTRLSAAQPMLRTAHKLRQTIAQIIDHAMMIDTKGLLNDNRCDYGGDLGLIV